MKALGSLQWQNGYPARPDIEQDIACGRGWVMCLPSAADAAKHSETEEDTAQELRPGEAAATGCADPDSSDPLPLRQIRRPGTKVAAPLPSHAPTSGDDSPSERNPEEVIAYCAIAFDGEPAYEHIEEGEWLTNGGYVVVHRLAVADEEKRRGRAAAFLHQAETLAHQRGIGSFRIDTNFDNRYMLRLLERLGFVHCGMIRYDSGQRMAFEKPL